MVKNCWTWFQKGVTLPGKVTPYQLTGWTKIFPKGIKKFFNNVEIINQIGPVSPEKISNFVNNSSSVKQWSSPLTIS